MKKLLLLLTAVLLLAGCGTQQAPLTLTNSLGAWNIHELTLTPQGGQQGNNLLTEPLTPGNTFTATVSAGVYDIRLVDNDGDTYTKRNVTLTSEGYTWDATLADLD